MVRYPVVGARTHFRRKPGELSRGEGRGSSAADHGKWGHADLSGNVDEWVLDAFARDTARCAVCADLTFDDFRTWTAIAPSAREPSRWRPRC